MASSKSRPCFPPLPSFLLLLTLSLLHPLRCSHAAQQPIQAIVVLVLENRSFDHMLGWMQKALNSSLNGLTGTECNHQSTIDPNSPSICISDDALYVEPDPDHSFQGVKQQVFGFGTTPSMSGFVEQALTISEDLANIVMKGFKPENLPVFASLVQEFAVFDRWFSSLPGPTQPNRLFVYSATSHGATSHNKLKLFEGYPQKTIFDSLHDDGLDFNIYFESAPTTLLYRRLRKLKYVSKFHKFGTFMDHARDGRLAKLSVLEPRYFDLDDSPANDDHPSHDVANGQKLVKDVYEALRASPQWNESLLIITYDEHGGFYDHVATPNVGIPSPDGIIGPEPYNFGFDRLGVRVPTIAISPWIKKGTVVTRPNGPTPTSEFEHSSIPATIKKLYNLTSDFLTQRDAWAGTFESILSELTSPRTDCPEVLPDVLPLRATGAKEEKLLSEFQGEIVQLAAVLCGDGHSISLNTMTVKEAHGYAKNVVSRFLQASKESLKSGADELEIVDMRASLNARTTSP
ncbi:non-specific phospholipase C6 [Elaeis guineensis]|uniref:non-specific phospholipase C6 n=1 Tax=Elaeis guineensis var. tenera TaxID=51953 RepID=UPI003C6CDEA0